MDRPLTAEEKALKAAKKAEEKEAVRIAECLKWWQDVNSNKTVFSLDILPPERAWTQLKLRKGASLLQIYRRFYTDKLIDRLGHGLKSYDFVMGKYYTTLI